MELQEKRRSPQAARGPASLDEPIQILIVDDRPENLLAMEAVLGDLGPDVRLITATSGPDALREVLRRDFAVILMDVQMPEMDGFEAASLIRSRERSRHTPIVFITAVYKHDAHMFRGYAVGAVDYILKPVAEEVLRAKVSAFVELARSRQELEREIARRRAAEERARRLNEELERRVRERTAALEAEIAERRVLEAELQKRARELEIANERKNEFLAVLAHELRNPLAPIHTAVQTLRMHGADDPALSRTHEILDRQVQHLCRLVDDLLDVSRISRGKIELEEAPVELNRLIPNAVEAVRPLVAARSHRLAVRVPAESFWLHADAVRLEQVLANLLNNAAKYTEPGGLIQLTVEREPRNPESSASPARRAGRSRRSLRDVPWTGEWVVVRIRDTGVGIEPELLDRIFEPFAQAQRALNRAHGGLGLGLTLARTLVELHGGTLTAHSDGPGRGSEFRLRLPLRAAPSSPGNERSDDGADRSDRRSSRSDLPSPNADPRSASRRILIVDDNVDAAETLADVLVGWGHEVRAVHSGPAALALVEDWRPDLVLLDLGLGEMDGYQVSQRLRALPGMERVPFIAVTGFGQAEDRERSLEAGLEHHLVKPVDLNLLRGLIDREATPAPSEEPAMPEADRSAPAAPRGPAGRAESRPEGAP